MNECTTEEQWLRPQQQAQLVQQTPSTPKRWTICTVCNGNGKISKTSSRKARLRHKRAKLQTQTTTDDDVMDAEVSTDSLPPPMRVDPCHACNKTGLVAASSPSDISSMASTIITATTNNANYLPHVAIVGGGLGGLALAIACSHRSIPFTVYERDDHFYQRSQGYGLTMQQASGALSAFGIAPTLKDGVTSTKHVVHTPDGTVVGEWGLRKWGRDSRKTPPKRQNIHIARQALRHELLQALGGHTRVCWSHKLLDYKLPPLQGDADGNVGHPDVQLTFQVGEEIVHRKANIVVGADGIRSTVRKKLVGDDVAALRYLGCLVVLGICPLANLPAATRDDCPLLDGETVFQTADGSTRIYVMPYSDKECMWQLSFPMSDEAEAKSISREGAAALKEKALFKCASWHSPIPEILRQTSLDLVSGYPVYDRSLLTMEMLKRHSNRSNCVTLLGDAAHPMSPFKGQGANQALLDALSLARTIHNHCFTGAEGSLEKALDLYNQEMLSRSAAKVQASADAAEFLHTEVAIQPGNVTRGAAAAVTNTP
jgi:salicylate hydroxylase